MPGAVLGSAWLLRGGLAVASLLPALSGLANTVVEGERTQCCSSIAPKEPGATYYGAIMSRDSDPRSRYRAYLAPPDDPPGSIDEMLARVDALEGSHGAMGAQLSTALHDLGAAYLARKRYREAIDAFRRAIHVSRVNEGLHTPTQLASLEQLILTLVRQGDYAGADRQQAYLYRVRGYGHAHGSTATLDATLRYADWMRGAYVADLDKQRFPRLVDLGDLYGQAIDAIESSEGEDSPRLLPYLQGRIELSYLVSVYPGEKEGGFQISARQRSDFTLPSEAQIRFWKMREYNFRYGLQALKQKAAILETMDDAPLRERANAALAIGDWYQWHRRYARAISFYEQAWALMGPDAQGQRWRQEHLSQPLELPKETVFNPGLVPLDIPNSAAIQVRFAVNRHGEAKDITILTPRTKENQAAVTRAYHYLRNVRFRPQVADGSVVRTNNVERTYNIRF